MQLSSPGALLFASCCWLLALGWLRVGIAGLRGIRRLDDLNRIDPASLPDLEPGTEPHLSVVVPARNEAAAVGAALRSLVASDGIRLEILAVDDRSTDETGAIMDAVAIEGTSVGVRHSLQVQHIHELPQGWLGKPHAMVQAVQRASAPWLLFTDGDVLFAPHTLALALRLALARRADHLVLAPTLIVHNWAERAVVATLNALSQWVVRPWKVADPRARDALGVGGFNLVRREVYDRVGGFDRLRMAVVEDMALGGAIKSAGGRQWFAIGRDLVRVRWLEGVFGVLRASEKNGLAVFGYRTWLATLAGVGMLAHCFVPYAGLAVGGWARWASLATYAGVAMTFIASRRMTWVSPWLAVFFGPAALLSGYSLLRSIFLTLKRGGVRWRGTFYPLAELRVHARRAG